jgi:hypothetical protein
MPDCQLPEVKILHAFKVSDTEEAAYVYPNMKSQIEVQRHFIGDRWNGIEQSPEDSIELADPARALAMFYMIKTADKLLLAESEAQINLWSERFTNASRELYGAPEENESSILAARAIAELSESKFTDGVDPELMKTVVSTYKTLIRHGADASPENTASSEVIQGCKDFLEQEYRELFELIDTEKDYAPSDLLAVFTQALSLLAEKDVGWQGWKAELRPQGNLEIDGEEHTVLVGEKRHSATGEKFKGLLAHELLIHAQRRVRAEKHDDVTLQRGLPGYLDAEEGLGIFTDYVLTGEISQTSKDRYTDIALALGGDDRKSMTRTELFEFVRSREILRKQINSEEIDENEIDKRSWQHVYRIFRGGSGRDHSATPAVFTKDIAYYNGFAKIKGFFESKLKEGKSVEEIYTYLLAGKFDPENEIHKDYIAKYDITL